MTNNQLKQRVKDLTTQIQDMERQLPDHGKFDPEFAKVYIPLRQELHTATLLLSSRRNPIQEIIDIFYFFSASWPLLLSGYSLGRSFLLVGLNFLAMLVLLRQARCLTQVMHRRSIFFWLLSELGGNLPEWYAYRASLRRRLWGLAVFFIAWLIPYYLLLPFSGVGIVIGSLFMVGTVILEARLSRLDLMKDVYPVAKGVADLKSITQRIDSGDVDLSFHQKRG